MKMKAAIVILFSFLFSCNHHYYVHGKHQHEEDNNSQIAKIAPAITFSDDEFRTTKVPLDDELVVTMNVGKIRVDKILIDTGASTNILFLSSLNMTKLSNQVIDRRPTRNRVEGLFGGNAESTEIITLPVTAGRWPRSTTVAVDFLLVDSPLMGYNIIFGRPGIRALRAIPSTYHLLLCFPTKAGIGEVRGDGRTSEHYKGRCRQREARSTEALLLAFEVFSVFILFVSILNCCGLC